MFNFSSDIVKQKTIINNFKLFCEIISDSVAKKKFLELDEQGTCNGLVYAYKMYAHQDQRKEYVLALMFINPNIS